MNISANQESVRVRSAVPTDVPELTKLINAAFVVERPFLEGQRIDERGSSELFERGKFLIAEDFSGITGCVFCELRGDRGYLGLLAVKQVLQGMGLGRKLMDAAEEHFRRAGCVAVDLRVISQRTPLPAFYRHLGYMETGTAPFAPSLRIKAPGQYILMSKPLM